MGLGVLVVFAVIVALIGVVWWLESAPPDDPWMLKNSHRLAHHYSKGMGPGSVDHALQESAAEKRDARDERLSAVRKQHTDPPRHPVSLVKMSR
jgi:hypothetical protein